MHGDSAGQRLAPAAGFAVRPDAEVRGRDQYAGLLAVVALEDQPVCAARGHAEVRGRKVDERRLKLGGEDSHWLDALVGCAGAASVLGCVFEGVSSPKRRCKYGKFSVGQCSRPPRKGWTSLDCLLVYLARADIGFTL